MRVPVQCGTIRITSSASERRLVSVSGLAKLRLLWLFRNFSILDYSVLTRAQQQLIGRVWHAGRLDPDDDAVDVIGTIEGLSPKPAPATPVLGSAKAQAPAPALTPVRRPRFAVPGALRAPAIWTASAALLVGATMYLPQRPFLTRTLPLRAAAVAPTSSPVKPLAVPAVEAPAESATTVAVASAPPTVAPLAVIPKAPSPAAFHPPNAMSANASLQPALPPDTWVVVNSKVVSTKTAGAKTTTRSEVILHVSVDRKGRAQAVQVVSGNQSKIPAAKNAAKVWHFEPCSDADTCEHVLKYTDFGDASSVQVLD